ncbi:MAG: hypothetical protein HW374_1773 [Bacteroidetes bacterium]|nr:hypothetical protein [Bacteroidota bacterium]
MSTIRIVPVEGHWLRRIARALILLWGFFWALFGLFSGLGEGGDVVGTVFHITVPGLIFFATAILAWWYEKLGGVTLLAEGLVVAISYPLVFRAMTPSTVIFVLLTMALPPLLAGSMFLLDWRKSHPTTA